MQRVKWLTDYGYEMTSEKVEGRSKRSSHSLPTNGDPGNNVPIM